MSHAPHALQEEFPDLAARIRTLKRTDSHFARLADAYRELDRRSRGAETLIAPVEVLTEVEMRKTRDSVKDGISRILTASA